MTATLIPWSMVANERYVIHFPENMPLDVEAPLLCAEIIVYNPLKYLVSPSQVNILELLA